MVREAAELYIYQSRERGYGLSKFSKFEDHVRGLALVSGCSSFTNDFRVGALLASSFTHVALRLVRIDLRATNITAISIITIFQTCPSLEQLDVGECKQLNIIDFACILEETPRITLVVKHLQTIEICGCGNGTSWVGYRPQLGLCREPIKECIYTRPTSRRYGIYSSGRGRFEDYGLPEDIENTERFAQVVRLCMRTCRYRDT